MNKTAIQEKLLKPTKYSKWYLNIIENAQSQNRTKLKKTHKDYCYYEEHHILPKAKGLFDEYTNLKEHPWNGVLLTAKEHFICHICIWKHFKTINYKIGKIKMARGVQALSNFGEYNSKSYQHFKLNLTCTKETSKILSDMRKGYVSAIDEEGNIFKIKETDERWINGELNGSTKGYIACKNLLTNETFNIHKDDPLWKMEHIVGVKYGTTLSLEDKHKKSLASKDRTWIRNLQTKQQKLVKPYEIDLFLNDGWEVGRGIPTQCPHCGFIGTTNMSRYHFDRCKEL